MAHSELELRAWAIRILSADTIDEKLFAPRRLTDNHPGNPLLWDTPTRPAGMGFKLHQKSEKLPPLHDLHDPNKRAMCLHRFAGHELLAVEIMAYTLLACPHAPKHFRKGLASTLKEEQEHVRLYMKEMARFGMQLGDMPLYKHFWAHTPHITRVENYVSTMCLTLEMANLDFAPMFKSAFEHHDKSAAALMQRILDDEISHVSFGYNWLKKLKPDEKTCYEMWKETVSPTITPRHTRGRHYSQQHRKSAGIDEHYIKSLESSFQ